MTIKALYPSTRPTLNLDFAKTKALDPRVTFTRASTATFVGADGLIKTAASGAARFDHNPATGESLGLLVEEARTNLTNYSEQFDNAVWTKTNASITVNATTAPDGSLTADKLVENTANTAHYFDSATPGSLSNATFSIYVKPAGRTRVAIYAFGLGNLTNFDLTGSGSVISGPGSIQAASNGWYRCSVSSTTATFNLYGLSLINTGTNNTYTGDGTSGVFLWGAQVEAGAFPTSYIPTTTATVTRAADVASITGTNFSSWYNPNPQTWLIKYKTPYVVSNVHNPTLINHGTLAFQFDIAVRVQSSTTTLLWDDRTPETFVQSTFAGKNLLNGTYGLAIDLPGGNMSSAFNGSVVTDSFSAKAFASTGEMYIGTATGSSFTSLNGTIARLAYYPVRLSDTQLQALTAT